MPALKMNFISSKMLSGMYDTFIRMHFMFRQHLVLYLFTMIIFRDGKEEWAPFDLTPYCSSSAFDSVSSMLQEVNSCLHSLEISVEQVSDLIFHYEHLSF